VSLDVEDPAELVDRMRDAAGGDGPTYVFDPLWGSAVEAAMAAAAPGARIVNLGQSAGPNATLPSGAVRGKQLDIYGYLNFAVPADARADAHRRLLDHAQRGELRIPIDEIGLDDVAAAWQRQVRGTDRKLVIRTEAKSDA
jgi:NADPH:quinone reductase